MLYCILFSSQSKAPKEKMDKKEVKCRICDVYHIHCAKPAPQRLLSPLNFGKFLHFLSSLSLFLQNYWRLWFYSSGPGHRQAPGLCGRHPGGQSPVVFAWPTANLFLRVPADTQMLSEASPEAMQNGAKLAPFCFCLLPSSISKYSTTNDISLTESSLYIRKIKWLL